ncbi:MAG: DUF6049 family protein [Leucobacter sp.]
MPLRSRSSRAFTPIREKLAPAITMALALALAALFGLITIPPSAARAVEEPEPPTAVPAELLIAPVEAVVDPSANQMSFAVRVENPGETELAAGRLQVQLALSRVDTVAQLDDPFPGGVRIADLEIGTTAAGESQTVRVTVRGDDLPLTDTDRPGVYRVQAELAPLESAEDTAPADANLTDTDAAGPEGRDPESIDDPSGGAGVETDSAADTGSKVEAGEDAAGDADTEADSAPEVITADTAVVWRGPGSLAAASPTADLAAEPARARLGTIVPLLLPRNIDAMPTTAQLGDLAPRLDALLDTAVSARATLAIDPRLIAGIRLWGDAAPASARNLLERLETIPLQSFLLQFADADPAAQAVLGYTELLQPTELSFATRYGGGEGSPNADIPSLEELLDWPQQRTPVGWPAEGQVDGATLDLLTTEGIDTLVLSSDNVDLDDGPNATLGKRSALIADARLGDSVRLAVSGGEEIDRQSGLSTAIVQLALAAQNEGPDLLLTLDRGAIASAEQPEAVLDILLDLEWVTPVVTTDLSEGSATLRAAAPLEERRELLRRSAAEEADVTAVGAVLLHPEDLAGYQRARLLNLFATRYAAADVNFPAAAERFAERDNELRTGVHGLRTETTQLVGTSTRVPVELRNALPFEAIVNVRVDPASAALRLDERVFPEITVPAEGAARVLVPVLSRVSSGESALLLEVTDQSGEYIAVTDVLPLTIRSGIEAIALWVLGAAAALLLVFGTVRSVQRRRRWRAGQVADPSPESDEYGAGEPGTGQ